MNYFYYVRFLHFKAIILLPKMISELNMCIMMSCDCDVAIRMKLDYFK